MSFAFTSSISVRFCLAATTLQRGLKLSKHKCALHLMQQKPSLKNFQLQHLLALTSFYWDKTVCLQLSSICSVYRPSQYTGHALQSLMRIRHALLLSADDHFVLSINETWLSNEIDPLNCKLNTMTLFAKYVLFKY